MEEPLIQLIDVWKRFGEQQVLRGAAFSVRRGEITTVVGMSGGGKSVLLKHMIGLMEPDSGRILFEGRPISRMKKAQRRALKKRFSYMFQSTALFDSMTVFENVALPLKEKRALSEAEIRKKVHGKMAELDLQEVDGKYPSQLSGGMKKRVALARALVTDPEIVLFDEPTTGLDPIRKNAVHRMIAQYQQRFGFTAVIVSHEIPDVFYISQRIAMLHEGKILFEGTPEQFQATEDSVVQQFVRGLESRHDLLTGLAPQPEGEKRFHQEMARLQRHKIAFSLILLTVENLDEIIREVGQVQGLQIMKDFASQLQRRLRITDTCARYGLNRIMVILPNTDLDQAHRVYGKLTAEMNTCELVDVQTASGFCFSVSAGFAQAVADSKLENVLAAAEAVQRPLYRFAVG